MRFFVLFCALVCHAAGGVGFAQDIVVDSNAGIMANHAAPSPDGKLIAFHRRGGGEMASLFLKNLESGEERHLFGAANSLEQEPRWSPDSKWIAFVSGSSYTGGEWRLNIIGSNGAGHRVLFSTDAGLVKGPSWAPDGRTILFEVRNAKEGQSMLYTVGLDGATPTPLFPVAGGMWVQGEYSPSRDQVVAIRRDADGEGSADLFVFDLATGSKQQLTRTAEAETMPVWTADGEAVVFARPSAVTGQHDLFLLRLKTREEKRLTDTPDVEEFFPALSADGKTLYFDMFQMIDGAPISRIARISLR